MLHETYKSDPDHIQILNYTQTVELAGDDGDPGSAVKLRNSALHRANACGNQRSVDIILEIMSLIPLNSAQNFSEILGDLIDHEGFSDYMSCLPVQTGVMKQKHVLKVDEPLDDKIVALSHSSSMVIDDRFFKEQMGEKESNSTFPVKVVGLKIGWILNKPEGKEFLLKIQKTDNMEVFNIDSV